MSRKMESYTISELVAIFANKWKLEILDSKHTLKKYPSITQDNPGEYYIWFKGALNPFTMEKLSKKVMIHPDEHLGQYQLKQLIAASKGEYSEHCKQSKGTQSKSIKREKA